LAYELSFRDLELCVWSMRWRDWLPIPPDRDGRFPAFTIRRSSTGRPAGFGEYA